MNAPITNSIHANGIITNAADHSPRPLLTVAIQKTPIVAKLVTVPEMSIDLRLLPKACAHNQKINTNTAVNNVSHTPHISAWLRSI